MPLPQINMGLKVDVPAAQLNNLEIQKFTVSEHQSMLTMFAHGGANRMVPAGTYTRLLIDGETWMSDTPAEVNDHMGFVRRASGHVLITGLGIGMVVSALLKYRDKEVKTITVIEQNHDVIELVAPHYGSMSPKVKIIQGDAWKPATHDHHIRYDWAWHDIWPTLDSDNCAEFDRMRALWAPYADCQMFWGRALCEQALEEFENLKWSANQL